MAYSRLSAVLVVLVLLIAACGEDGADPRRAGGGARAAREVAAPRQGEPSAEAVALPKRSVKAWLEDGSLVSVLSDEAPRGAILAALSEATGFELVIGTEAELPQPLSLREKREAVEVVLARVLVGVPHALAYDKDPSSGLSRLARVTVGAEGSPVAVVSAPPAPDSRERRRELSEEEQRERADRADRVWAQSIEDLASYDEEVRADGAHWLNVGSTEGFQAATEHLAQDPSPLVRAAAAEALKESDVGAVQPLLQALDDPDSRVVLAALETLEFVGDASTVPHLAPALEHRDAEVRERTVQAIEFLQ